MKKISHHAIGLLQGSDVLFSDFESGGVMWTGEGPRVHRQSVQFKAAFLDIPAVHIGLSMWDIERGENQRVDIRAEAITRTGFTISFATWGRTHVARIRADWLAIGPAAFDDDFDV